MAAIQGDWYASACEHALEDRPADPDAVRYVYAVQPSDEKYIVAKVWAGDDGDYEATARLVAAAPDLLEACREAVSAITYLLSNSDDDPNYADTLNTLAAAIVKAEGRSE